MKQKVLYMILAACLLLANASDDNPRRSFTAWVIVVADAEGEYKDAVLTLRIDLSKSLCE